MIFNDVLRCGFFLSDLQLIVSAFGERLRLRNIKWLDTNKRFQVKA